MKYLLFIFIFLGCERNVKSGKKKSYLEFNKVLDTLVLNHDILLGNNIKKQKLISFFQEVNVKSVKQNIDGVTTTFLSKKDIIFFENKKKNNFFARYDLIKKDRNGIPRVLIGNMIVYDSINPYVYEKKTEEFIELNIKSERFSILQGKIKIGQSLNELIEVLGKYNFYYKGYVIYKLNNKIAFFKIKGNRIFKIKIGIYKKDIKYSEIIDNE